MDKPPRTSASGRHKSLRMPRPPKLMRHVPHRLHQACGHNTRHDTQNYASNLGSPSQDTWQRQRRIGPSTHSQRYQLTSTVRRHQPRAHPPPSDAHPRRRRRRHAPARLSSAPQRGQPGHQQQRPHVCLGNAPQRGQSEVIMRPLTSTKWTRKWNTKPRPRHPTRGHHRPHPPSAHSPHHRSLAHPPPPPTTRRTARHGPSSPTSPPHHTPGRTRPGACASPPAAGTPRHRPGDTAGRPAHKGARVAHPRRGDVLRPGHASPRAGAAVIR